MRPGLYIVGTPIGNLDDLSPRAVETLRGVEAILAEDTRRTRVLLDRFGLRTPLISCHKFSEASKVAALVERMQAGAALALVSDSGMPVVSDPGARLVSACHAARIPVTVIPGPSAVTAAVAMAGFGGQGFHFRGFLPRKAGPRGRELDHLLASTVAVVLFESPHRLGRLLQEITARAPQRPVFVGRELTKHFEEYWVGRASELAARLGNTILKGEVVVVVGPQIDTPEGGCYGGQPCDGHE